MLPMFLYNIMILTPLYKDLAMVFFFKHYSLFQQLFSPFEFRKI